VADFHNLIKREIPRLRRYARALTRSGDRADDLVQETLLRAIAKSHLWQTGTDIRAWLFTILHNQYVNTVRRAMREGSTIDIEQMSSSLVATTDPTASCQLRELERALACLPGEQREVILLVGLEGMSYETAAQVLSVPVGTVLSLLSHGRDALRRLMDIPERGAGKTAQASGALAARGASNPTRTSAAVVSVTSSAACAIPLARRQPRELALMNSEIVAYHV
jgi:RNA polymerase sigma-70 factor, ECF subfamily